MIKNLKKIHKACRRFTKEKSESTINFANPEPNQFIETPIVLLIIVNMNRDLGKDPTHIQIAFLERIITLLQYANEIFATHLKIPEDDIKATSSWIKPTTMEMVSSNRPHKASK